MDHSAGPSALGEASAILRRLAEARSDYAQSTPRDEDRTLLSHEVAVMNAVADALSGRKRWEDLVADYAPSWRWHELGDHNPELRLFDGRRPSDIGTEPIPEATRGVEL